MRKLEIEIVKENGKYILKSNRSYKTLKGLVEAMDKYDIPRKEFSISANVLMDYKP